MDRNGSHCVMSVSKVNVHCISKSIRLNMIQNVSIYHKSKVFFNILQPDSHFKILGGIGGHGGLHGLLYLIMIIKVPASMDYRREHV